MHQNRMKSYVTLVLLFVTIACNSNMNSNAPTSSAINLSGSTFRLTSFNGMEIPTDQNYVLTLESESIQAKFCNSMRGSYTIANDVITAKLVSTKMFCHEPSNLMDIENTFGRILNDGASISLQGSTLVFKGTKGEELVFNSFD
jgi:heat shock protein HslJ